jgi:glycogen debranching enzyme
LTDIVRLENEYYVRASSALADDRTRVLKHGDTFAVFNRFGDIESLGNSQLGLFHADCRHLSRFTMHVNGRQPLLLSSTISDDNAILAVDLTNVDTVSDGGSELSRGTLHIFRMQFLLRSQCHAQLRLLNYGSTPIEVSILLSFESDFADIFEVRGTTRKRRGERLAGEVTSTSAILAYCGLDNVLRRTRIEFMPTPLLISCSEARFKITLNPKQEQSIFGLISCERGQSRPSQLPFAAAYSQLNTDFSHAGQSECHITTSSESFNAWLTRSSADLRMLTEGNPEGPYPYAGVPWYNTIFGRDGIITALECLWLAPSFAKGVLGFLAETQATAEEARQDAEPGKIVHEIRRGEMAETKEVPFGRYYGSIDSTPLFVMLAGAYLRRTGDLSFTERIWPAVRRALNWLEAYGDCDDDGFVEYTRRSADGLVQQGWKDSHDSVFHANGDLAEAPIALCEVQGYTYAAKRAGAAIAKALGEQTLELELEEKAESLRVRFEETFWSDELGSYVLALDGNKRQCRVRASNAGHLLFCKIASQQRAEIVAELLMSQQLFGGWGVRTLGSAEARYNPMSYHNGSVWPHDNALIAMGFSNYRLQRYSSKILEGIYEASRYFELRRTPELFCGFHRRSDGGGPTSYPVACAPQAWAAAAVFLMIQACIGIDVMASKPQVCFAGQELPSCLDELRIDNLRVGSANADILLRRKQSIIEIEVLRQKEIDISVQAAGE